MRYLISLIPVLPLAGFLILAFVGKRLNKVSAGVIACGTVFSAFILSLIVFMNANGNPTFENGMTITLFDWISVGSFRATFSFLIDPLSLVFLLVITGVGFLIHLYSVGYMKEDEGYNRYFSYLNLFIFFMTLLVLGNNFLLMFVGWEGVGFCSYLLIGFWFKNSAYNDAAVKAFVMNRIGDLGFLLGIILIFITFGSIEYASVFAQAGQMQPGGFVIIAITLLLFLGAIGKSAQIPLYTWLPDAMAGPTPVSALIHAATMVTAGIYMIARTNILYTMAPLTLQIIAGIGIATALLGATIGLVQNDIKKVLAYSTVSQLGLMFLALGVGAYNAAVFHVVTHAFFKALLFLGAGSVIHALHGEQDIRRMGGLRKLMPVTWLAFLIASIAISGIPPFAGFFSKDEILMHVYASNPMLWVLAVLCSVLTAFYVFRLFFLTFSGEYRGDPATIGHLHKTPMSMSGPLIVLAVLSAVGGLIGIPELFSGGNLLGQFLSPVFGQSALHLHLPALSHEVEYVLIGISVVVALLAVLFAMYLYAYRKEVSVTESSALRPVHNFVYHKYYVDELYQTLITKPLQWLGDKTYRILELKVVDGVVEWIGRFVVMCGKSLRLIQNGESGIYLLAMVVAIIVLIVTANF